jgi:DNA-binding winged helix-turn-helix (wHTH) protein
MRPNEKGRRAVLRKETRWRGELMTAFALRSIKNANGLFYFTEPEFVLTKLLLEYRIVTRALAYEGVFGDRYDDQKPIEHSLNVLLNKLRAKLRQFDIEIDTVWGRGWYLTDPNRNKLAALIASFQNAPSGIPVRRTSRHLRPLSRVALNRHREEMDLLAKELPNPPSKKLRLTRTESVLIDLLLEHHTASQDVIYARLYGHRPSCDQPTRMSLHVLIASVRKKMRPHGVAIELVYGVGWRLSAQNRKRLRSILRTSDQ